MFAKGSVHIVCFLFCFSYLLCQKPSNMKQTILLSLAILFCFIGSVNAQIGKGSLWLGGGIGYNSSKTDNNVAVPQTQDNNFNFNPGIGVAVKNNLILGADITFNSEVNKSPNYVYSSVPVTETKKTKTYGVGVFLREYFPVINRLYIFGQERVYYSAGKTTDQYGGNTDNDKNWGTGFSFYPGVSFALTKKLQLESGFNNLFNVNYSQAKVNGKQTNESFEIGATSNNSGYFTIGFR